MPGGDVPLERQLKILQDELRQAQRMAALGELVSTTTHEFNNVLTTILNYAKIGLRQKDDATRDKSLHKILEAAQRAERITNGVLGLARNRSKDKVPTDLSRLVDESLILLEREMRKYRVAVETRFETSRQALVCGNQIQQVLMNLLTNARQAMPRGGRVVIRIAEDAASDTVDLSVRDTGTGIPPGELPKIFDRYYSTKAGPDSTGKGGTGLGLTMCRDIIEEHQGRIRVESTVGVGTAITLKLPIARQDNAPAPVPKLGALSA
jgi:signal transduction histidine kinase